MKTYDVDAAVRKIPREEYVRLTRYLAHGVRDPKRARIISVSR